MLVFIEIPAGGKILHAGGQVVGLVDGVVEDGVGGNDAGRSGEDQEYGEKHGPAGLRMELQNDSIAHAREAYSNRRMILKSTFVSNTR
jgi:hypothetical protein